MATFNVQDYGAVGDGTTDDTAAIQAAIDAAYAAGGGEVYVPPGTYSVAAAREGSALVLKAHVYISGETADTSILRLAAGDELATSMIRTLGDDLGASRLTLDGNRANQATEAAGWVSRAGDHLLIDSVTVTGASGHGFDLRGTTEHIEFLNNTATDNGRDGVAVAYAGQSTWVNNAAINNDGNGFSLAGALTLYDSVAESNGGDGFVLQQGAAGSPSLVSGRSTANGDAGISVAGADGFGISYMEVRANQAAAIAVLRGTGGDIGFNQLSDNGRAGPQAEVTLGSSLGNNLHSNLIQGGAQTTYGIQERGSQNGDNRVEGNTVLSTHSGAVKLTGDGSEAINTVTTVSTFGTAATDYLNGDASDDILYGGGGDDDMSGATGHNLFIGGAGRDTLYGEGVDTFRFTALTDSYRTASGAFADLISNFKVTTDTLDVASLGFSGLGNGHNGTLQASYNSSNGLTYLKSLDANASGQRFELTLAGNYVDTLTSANFQPLVKGTTGSDSLDGTTHGSETLLGLAGADTLAGRGGDDRLQGGAGGDRLLGGAGADTFVYTEHSDSVRSATNSTAGRDTVVDFDPQQDRLDLSALGFKGLGDGHEGTLRVLLDAAGDTLLQSLEADAAGTKFEIRLSGNHLGDFTSDNLIFADTSGEEVTSTLFPFQHAQRGTAGVDHLTGTSGADMLEGQGGNDLLLAGAGRDGLNGGAGADRLAGGSGSDFFLFLNVDDSYRTATQSHTDLITDFTDDGVGHDNINVTALGFYDIGDGTGGTLKVQYNAALDRTYVRDLEGDGHGHYFQVALAGDHEHTLTRQNFNFPEIGPPDEVGLLGVAEPVDVAG